MKTFIISGIISLAYLLSFPTFAEVSDWDAAACGARKLSVLHGGGFGVDPAVVDGFVKNKKIKEAGFCTKYVNNKCESLSPEFGDKSLMLNVFTKFPMKSGTGVAKLYAVTKERCDFRYEPSNNPNKDGRVIFSIKKD